MQHDTTIISILRRYENNQPVTIEEKAVLHKWLIKSLRAKNLATPRIKTIPTRTRALRKKILFWQYAFIILMLFAIAITLYLFAVEGGRPSIKKSDDNVHGNYQEIREPG